MSEVEASICRGVREGQRPGANKRQDNRQHKQAQQETTFWLVNMTPCPQEASATSFQPQFNRSESDLPLQPCLSVAGRTGPRGLCGGHAPQPAIRESLPSLLLAPFSYYTEGTLGLPERQAPKDQRETSGSIAAILLRFEHLPLIFTSRFLQGQHWKKLSCNTCFRLRSQLGPSWEKPTRGQKRGPELRDGP